MIQDTYKEEIEKTMEEAWKAFQIYRDSSLVTRGNLMRSIAKGLEESRVSLVEIAKRETNLSEPRLNGELSRTIFQLTSYATFCESGQWLDIRIDTASHDTTPPKPDLRKMLIPLGPVIVFGASNFPFAYSTAGGDTACALAAGCPVVVKGHPAHAETSAGVAEIIKKSVSEMNLPGGTFAHVAGTSPAVGEALVKHPYTKAVGFTGSFAGGKQLFDWGNQRKEPIPVFAEMSSVNPVFLLPGKTKEDPVAIAKQLAASITLGIGQFCTNPGIIIAIANEDLQALKSTLKDELAKTEPAKMLNEGIAKNYIESKTIAISQPGVHVLIQPEPGSSDPIIQAASITETTASAFIKNPILQKEVFGSYSIIVECRDIDEMKAVANTIAGQLTATIHATPQEIIANKELVDIIKTLCGRLILNSVPTGVEVALSMQHGGPFPSTTDSRFSSVGADGIKRFARPISYQNWPDNLLPEVLQNSNPLKTWRTINNVLTKEEIA